MLILNKQDMKQTVDYAEIMDTVEDAYRLFHSGDFYMPHRPTITHGENTLLYMPCFKSDAFGTKFLTVFPGNPAKGHPYIDGLMLINDQDSGKTIAIMDAAYLTALRTGAAGGVGTRHFSRKNSKSVGIIGAGKQGYYLALYAAAARNISDIYVCDTAPGQAEDFARRLEQEPTLSSVKIHICGTARQLVENSEIIFTATPAVSPVVPDEADLLRGKCFIAIGSYKPNMRELPNAIWPLTDNIYTELPFALEESGDFSQPIADGLLKAEQVKYIGEWLSNNDRHPPKDNQTTVFKSVGMGLLDLCVGQLIYNKAKQLGIGQEVAF